MGAIPGQSGYGKRLRAQGCLISAAITEVARDVDSCHNLPRLVESIALPCGASRGRTGLVCALLLANVGVAPEVIADDYTMSVRAMAGVASHQPIKDRQADWTPQAIDAWVETTHPLVVDFADEPTPTWTRSNWPCLRGRTSAPC